MHLVIYSGGMDSFTLLHMIHSKIESRSMRAISFDYGQRHRRELEYAQAETKRLGIAHEIIDLRPLTPFLQGSALTSPDIDVPEGHYAEESMKKTVVPGRNTLMLSAAMAYAESLLLRGIASDGYVNIHYGAHAGDHAIYPDCRPAFVNAMQSVFEAATEGKVRLYAPLLELDKADILRSGQMVGLKAEDYARTWTCYKGGAHACGKCGSCDERAEAFAAMNWVDPAMAWRDIAGI